MAKKGLGKGLDTLIQAPEVPVSAPKEDNSKKKQVAVKSDETVKKKDSILDEELEKSVIHVNITMVEPDREQPRKSFNEDALQELADSIKQFGVLEPILVQDCKDYYEIVAGERRWRAARLAGLKEVPVIIREFTKQEKVEIQLIENLQRENLNPIEEAKGYKRLLTEFNLKQDEVAERVSKSRTAVTNSVRLLKLSDEVQRMVIEEMISTGHARALLSIEDKDEQYNLAQKIFDEKLSVRDIEKIVKNYHKAPKTDKTKPQVDQTLLAIYQNIEEKLKQRLGTNVSVSGKGGGIGKIEIEFYSHDDLDRLLEMIGKN